MQKPILEQRKKMSEDFNKQKQNYEGTRVFEGDSTVSQSAGHIQKILILEKKEKMLYSWASYNSSKEGTGEKENNKRKLESNTISIILDLWAVLKRKEDNKEGINAEQLITDIMIGKEYVEVIKRISIFLDTVGLTKFDTRRDYDRTNVENENLEKGL